MNHPTLSYKDIPACQLSNFERSDHQSIYNGCYFSPTARKILYSLNSFRINGDKWSDRLKKELCRTSNMKNFTSAWKEGSICWCFAIKHTAQKINFSNKDFLSKCDQIRSFLRVWSHLLKKSIMENFIFCVVMRTSFSILEKKIRKNKSSPLKRIRKSNSFPRLLFPMTQKTGKMYDLTGQISNMTFALTFSLFWFEHYLARWVIVCSYFLVAVFFIIFMIRCVKMFFNVVGSTGTPREIHVTYVIMKFQLMIIYRCWAFTN